jgi:hypothetical protein
MDRKMMLLAVWLPDPFTVATWILMSLSVRRGFTDASLGATVSIVAIRTP